MDYRFIFCLSFPQMYFSTLLLPSKLFPQNRFCISPIFPHFLYFNSYLLASCKIGCHGASPPVPIPNRICKVGLVPALNPVEGSSENSNYRHRHILRDLDVASFQVFCILACLHSSTASQQRLHWSCLKRQNPSASHPVCFFSSIFFFSPYLNSAHLKM